MKAFYCWFLQTVNEFVFKMLSAMRMEIFTFEDKRYIFRLTNCETLMLISILIFLACESKSKADSRVLRKERKARTFGER